MASDERFSEAVVHRREDGTASIEWTYRSGTRQVLMSEELFLECIDKHAEIVRLREALTAATDENARLESVIRAVELTYAEAAIEAVINEREGYVTSVERWKAACTVECGWSQIHLDEESACSDLFRHREECHPQDKNERRGQVHHQESEQSMSTQTATKWEEYLDKAAACLEANEPDKAYAWVALADAHSRGVLAEKSANLA